MDLVSQTNIALEAIKNKQYKKAEKIYISLLKEEPNNTILLSFLGYLYLTVKKIIKAEETFEKAYSLSKTQTILEGLALTKFLLTKYNEAVTFYIDLINLEEKYEYYEKLTTSITTLISFGKREFIELGNKYCPIAYKKFPLSKEIILSYSILCIYTGRFKEGEKLCTDTLKIDPKNIRALSHLGFIKEGLYNDEEEAQLCYKKAIKYGSKYMSYYDLGVSLSKIGKYSSATRYFNKSLKSCPDNDIIYTSKAFNYFKQRKFKQGYENYLKITNLIKSENLKNIWDGKTHKNKTIYVFPDMSYGDHIMYMRYVPYLKEKFQTVKVFAFANLFDLFENSFEGIEFVKEIPDYDYSTLLSSIPYYLKMDFNNIPSSSGYIKYPKKIINSDKLKVGLCWEAGNFDLRSTIHRTISINKFADLLNQDFDFYSFQVGASEDTYKQYNITDLGQHFKTFADTASYLQAMDVVVSVDTSVANLAGALGIKTFMLIPYYPDWRWFDNIDTTEWYDSVKIFKQSYKHSWDNEILRIINELNKEKNIKFS